MTTTMATAITNYDSIKVKLELELELKTEDNTEASMLIDLLIQTLFNIIYIVRINVCFYIWREYAVLPISID